MEQERLEAITFNCGLDSLERYLLRRVQFRLCFDGYEGAAGDSTSRVRIFRLAIERTAELAPRNDFVHFSQIVRPRVKLKITSTLLFPLS